MDDRVFYVGAQRQDKLREFSGFVPAKFLTLNGRPVVDPAPGGSRKAYIYADPSDRYKIAGEVANQLSTAVCAGDLQSTLSTLSPCRVARPVLPSAMSPVPVMTCAMRPRFRGNNSPRDETVRQIINGN